MAASGEFLGACRMSNADILILAYGIWSLRFWYIHRVPKYHRYGADPTFRIMWQLSHMGSMMMLIGVIYETLGFFK